MNKSPESNQFVDMTDVEFWHMNYRQANNHFQTIMSNEDADTTAAEYADYCNTAKAPILKPGGWLAHR